ncbi:hypothetical protein IF1G_01619 [Cordyceps javanica]|uniref:Uncharacterized protein n=1 Tax=Cordyceps javanica TaxID=43265 RepID=A0A545VCH1_9HYPO|nr:hypothetical protein IF1G_01619 [Cordyceps javanica]
MSYALQMMAQQTTPNPSASVLQDLQYAEAQSRLVHPYGQGPLMPTYSSPMIRGIIPKCMQSVRYMLVLCDHDLGGAKPPPLGVGQRCRSWLVTADLLGHFTARQARSLCVVFQLIHRRNRWGADGDERRPYFLRGEGFQERMVAQTPFLPKTFPEGRQMRENNETTVPK